MVLSLNTEPAPLPEDAPPPERGAGSTLLRISRARGKLSLAAGSVWAAADILHLAHVSAAYPALAAAAAAAVAGWNIATRAKDREAGRRHAAQAARWIGGGGMWLTAATALGPLAGPEHALTVAYLAAVIAAYRRLHAHPLTAQARDWEDKRMGWHGRSHKYGLGGSHLLEFEETRLGYRLRIKTTGTGRRASQLAGQGSAVPELIAEDLGLPVSRVQASRHHLAGVMDISVQERDPWAEPIPHPLLDDDPEITLPVPATIREPAIIGQDPDTGKPLRLPLWDSHGAKVIAVVGKRGSGKTVLLNNIRERITAMADALLVNINVSGAVEDLEWQPACYESAVTRAQERKALGILDWLCDIAATRPSLGRQTATFQPDAEHPAIVCVIDEIGVLMTIPGAEQRLRYIASQCRKEGITLVFAGQRAVSAWMGGSDVRSQIDLVCIGKVGQQSEAGHAAGDLEIPNVSAHGEGHSGVWLIGEREAGGRYHIGRTFNLSGNLDVREIAYERRDRTVALEAGLPARPGARVAVAAGNGAPPPESYPPVAEAPPPAAQPDDLGAHDMEHGSLDDLLGPGERAQLAALDARRAANERLASGNDAAAERLKDIPAGKLDDLASAAWADEARKTIISDGLRLRLLRLCAGEGISGRALVDQLGETRYKITLYMNRLRFERLAEPTGRGKTGRYKITAEGQSWLDLHAS